MFKALFGGATQLWLLGLLAVAVSSTSAHAAPFAYVAEGSNNVSVVDTATNMVVATVAVGSFPIGVAITPDGAFAYVASFNSGNVSVIDTATNAVVDTVAVPPGPNHVAITPDGAFAYVTKQGTERVAVIDTATNTVVDTVTVGSQPRGVAITPF
jgi:YVTN family beta-propeller protein